MSDEPKRVHVSLRLAPNLKLRLDEAAQANGRSFTQEVELMLEQALLMRDVRKAIRAEMRDVMLHCALDDDDIIAAADRLKAERAEVECI